MLVLSLTIKISYSDVINKKISINWRLTANKEMQATETLNDLDSHKKYYVFNAADGASLLLRQVIKVLNTLD